ncbi:MAG: hypothetical protein WC821_02605 [archaeon]|jgi:hypothetical protein
MGKFSFGGESNPGDGSKLPLGKRIKRAWYNFKVSLKRNKKDEESSIHHVGRALK